MQTSYISFVERATWKTLCFIRLSLAHPPEKHTGKILGWLNYTKRQYTHSKLCGERALETDRRGPGLALLHVFFVVLAVFLISLKSKSLVPVLDREMLGATLSTDSVLLALIDSPQGFPTLLCLHALQVVRMSLKKPSDPHGRSISTTQPAAGMRTDLCFKGLLSSTILQGELGRAGHPRP